MNLLQLHRGSKTFGSKLLFDEASFAINEGEHVGVIGPNGAGKTTLFKALVNQIQLDSGDLIKSHKLSIGYLEQESKEPLDISAEQHLDNTSTVPLWELKQLGINLGLLEKHFAVPFHELSGGYRMRMKLLSLVGQQPNLMLLDEPTNFLDLESILTLEKFLQSFEGAFLLISHDREFLRRTTDHTLEVEGGEITKFPGNIDDYFEQKAQLRSILEAQAANQDAKRKHLQDFVDRFGAKATKARQAQSRVKMIEKMEKIEVKALSVRAKVKIPPPSHSGKEILNLENASLGYSEKTVVSDCTIRLEKGVHLGVVGFNGAGKSTLLKSLAGRLPLLSGEINYGYQVSLSYYAQHVSEELNPQSTVLESLQMAATPDLKSQEILNVAGSLLFSGDAVHKKISVLSGGEKSRVALGQILLKRSPLILLDEPTNHLDFDTVEALTEALREYPGTVVVVSHDRSFIGRIATKILEIRDGRAEIYPGTYDDYLWSLEKGALKDRLAQATNTAHSDRSREKVISQSAEKNPPEKSVTKTVTSKQLQSEIRDLQKKIKKQEDLVQKYSQDLERLNLDLTSAQGEKISELSKQLGVCAQNLQTSEDLLLEYMVSLEKSETLLQGLK